MPLCFKGKYADKKKLADEAIYLERVLCEEAGGWQDQIAVSFGGMNRIDLIRMEHMKFDRYHSPAGKTSLMIIFLFFYRFYAFFLRLTKGKCCGV